MRSVAAILGILLAIMGLVFLFMDSVRIPDGAVDAPVTYEYIQAWGRTIHGLVSLMSGLIIVTVLVATDRRED